MDLSGHEEDIPIPMSNSYVVHGTSTRPPPPPISNNNNTEEQSVLLISNSKKKIVVGSKLVKYRECLKNHAASMGGNATDGCGEFMPSGEEGTLEALKCSACSCHRNFHRKEVEGEQLDYYHHHHLKQGGTLRNAYGYLPTPRGGAPAAMIMPLGAMQHSESDEMEEGYGGVLGIGGMAPLMVRKRFRTKFTQEQKEKMLAFAEKVGWRLQRQEESIVQHFCQEIGVKRRVLKVWMHNNKHNLAKKNDNNNNTTLQLQ